MITIINITFFKPDDSEIVLYPNDLFNNYYETEWFDDEKIKDIVRNIDKVEYIGDNLFKSELLGYIPAEKLSTGSKMLIMSLKLNEGKFFQMSNLGGNCYKELAKFQYDIDIKFWVDCLPNMEDSDIRFRNIDTGKVYTDIITLIQERIGSGGWI